MATAADIAGIRLPDDAAEDSVSNLPVWQGRQLVRPLREAIVHHSINGSFSIRQGKWKLEMCPGSGGWSEPKPGQEAADAPPVQLYDLTEDIGERRNVYAAHPDIVEHLTQLLTRYIVEGRSTPGLPQSNAGGNEGPQLQWLQA
jgi:arylsulfatase A-like enzyme